MTSQDRLPRFQIGLPLHLRLTTVLLALCSGAQAQAPAVSPARTLPPPWAKGGQAGFLGPAPSVDDLAAHLRGALYLSTPQVSSSGAPAPLSLGWQLGASVSLWRWAEAGTAFSGRWLPEQQAHQAGPVELWLRAGPPHLGAVSLQAVLEVATGRGGFDYAGALWPSTTTLGAVLGLERGRLALVVSAAYQAAGEDLARARYHGLQASAGAWLTAIRGAPWGLQVGGEVLARVGGEDGPRGPLQLGLALTAGLRLVDGHGAAVAGGYGHAWGPGLPGQWGAVRVGYSYGRGYVRPPVDPAYPPLLDSLQGWLADRWARRARPPSVGRSSSLYAGGSPFQRRASVCQLPAPLLPPQVLRSCVVAGARFELSPPEGDILVDTTVTTPSPSLACDMCRPDPMPDYSPGGAGYFAVCAYLRWIECGVKPWDLSASGSSPSPPRPPGWIGTWRRPSVRPPAPTPQAAPPPPRWSFDAPGPWPHQVAQQRPRSPPLQSAPTPSAPRPGGAAPVLKGQAAVAAERDARVQAGEQVLGAEVTIRTRIGARRADLVVRRPDGEVRTIEVKAGNSPIIPKQAAKDALVEREGGVAVGKRAKEAGISGPIKVKTEVVRRR